MRTKTKTIAIEHSEASTVDWNQAKETSEAVGAIVASGAGAWKIFSVFRRRNGERRARECREIARQEIVVALSPLHLKLEQLETAIEGTPERTIELMRKMKELLGGGEGPAR